MRKDLIGKAGVAAVILLAPGGFLLGLALIARRYRARPAVSGPAETHAAEA